MAQIETERYVTTVAGKRYKLGDDDTPQLWSVELKITPVAVDPNTGFIRQRNCDPAETVFVEQAVLEDHGLVPKKKEPGKPAEEHPKTADDLILELLEHVRVYPAE